MLHHSIVNNIQSTVVFVAWLAAYLVIGGLVFVASDELLGRTGLNDLTEILVAVVLTASAGWLGASAIRRKVADSVAKRPS